MPVTKKTVHVKLGMRRSYFFPIASRPAGQHPTYSGVLDMGEAVLGHLAVTYASGDIPGDDRTVLHVENFISAQLDAETTCSELELTANIYGRKFADGVETSHIDDMPPDGAYGYIEPFLKADKSFVYRAVFLYLVTPMPAQEKDDSDTRRNDFNPVMNAVSYLVTADDSGAWRDRKEFNSMTDAEAWIMDKGGAASAFPVSVTVVGDGSATPSGTTYVTSGADLTLTFSSTPTAVYDNSVDVTESVEDDTYTIEAAAAPHDIIVIFPTT